MKKLTKLAASAGVAAITLVATVQQAEAKPVHKTFEDYCRDESLPADQRHFVEAVLDAIQTTDCAEPQRRVDEIGGLSIFSDTITNITPIKGFSGLDSIIFSRGRLQDISPLAALKDLTWLTIEDNLVQDLTPLAGLTKLVGLQLQKNRITDIRSLKELKQLKVLRLEENDITAFGTLATFTNLEKLNIGYPRSNLYGECAYPRLKTSGLIDSLKGLTKLKELKANSLDIADSAAIAALTELKLLHIDCNQLRDSAFLDALPGLQEAVLSFNPLRQISITKKNENMAWLDIQAAGITDPSFVKHLPNLRLLNLENNEIFDASTIVNLAKLQFLELNGNRIQDAAFVETLPALDILELKDNDIATFPFAKICPSLSSLDLSGNVLTNIEGIENSGVLRSLSIANNPIKDISPLTKLPPHILTYLDLSSTDITDLSPIARFDLVGLQLNDGNFSSLEQVPMFPTLKVLSMKNAGLTSIEGLYERFGELFILKLSDNPITDISELRHHKEFWTLELARIKVNSLADLSHLKHVSFADFSGMGLTSLEPLVTVDGLVELSLNDNAISDLSPLRKTASHLNRLELANNKITSLAPLADKKFLRYVHRLGLSGNPLGTTTAKSPENCPTAAPSKAVRDWCLEQ